MKWSKDGKHRANVLLSLQAIKAATKRIEDELTMWKTPMDGAMFTATQEIAIAMHKIRDACLEKE